MVVVIPFSFWFWLCYLCSGLSDLADGLVARALNQQSSVGAKLDSIADMVFAVAILIFVINNISFSTCIWIFTALIASIRIISYIIGLCKFKTFSALHTYANKITGGIVFAFPLLYFFFGLTAAGLILWSVALISSLEELMITIKSKKLNRDRKTIFC